MPDDSSAPALLSPAEEKFEYWRCRAGMALGPLVFAALLIFPIPGLTPEQAKLAAVLALAIIFWLSEAIPMAATSLLAPALCVPLGIAQQKAVFAPFASPIIFLFIGSFFLAEAMRLHGLDRRMALWVLTRPGVTRSPAALFGALGCMTAVLSMWMSNSGTTAMMLPIAMGVLATCPGLRDNAAVRCNLILLIAFAASIGGLGTPVGTPPNLIAIGALRSYGVELGFVEWMKTGVILVVVLTAFLLWHMRPRGLQFEDRTCLRAHLHGLRQSLGPLRPGERNTAIIFSAAVFLWMSPGLTELLLRGDHFLSTWLQTSLPSFTAGVLYVTDGIKVHFPEETTGLLCGLALFLLPVNFKEWKFTLTWREAVQIDWGTIFLFAGGLALGGLITSTGLDKAMGSGIQALLGQPGIWALLAVGIVVCILLSEAASNTASATVMAPILLGVAKAGDIPLLPVAVATGIACSFGFMLPVSTGPNAQAYATGHVPLPRMFRAGIALDNAGAVAIFLTVWLIYR